MTIDEAIDRLVAKYDEVKDSNWIADPVAWALYKTWREAEEERLQENG